MPQFIGSAIGRILDVRTPTDASIPHMEMVIWLPVLEEDSRSKTISLIVQFLKVLFMYCTEGRTDTTPAV